MYVTLCRGEPASNRGAQSRRGRIHRGECLSRRPLKTRGNTRLYILGTDQLVCSVTHCFLQTLVLKILGAEIEKLILISWIADNITLLSMNLL